jgi:ryanodine receptor 2
LALLIRKKLACFGSDSKITVRCLQVLIRAVDVSSVIKNSQEIVRASLLPFFSYAADDLTELINDLQLTRLANVKGTSQKPHANLDYIHMVLLPVLSSMFDHLGVNQYGCDVLTGEIQVASYKALNALWILGTQNLIERDWVKFELHRHRPLIGECLGAFSAAFPIAFLEPQFNLNNRYSIMYGLSASNLSEHSLEGQDIMNKLAKNLPSLQDIISMSFVFYN